MVGKTVWEQRERSSGSRGCQATVGREAADRVFTQQKKGFINKRCSVSALKIPELFQRKSVPKAVQWGGDVTEHVKRNVAPFKRALKTYLASSQHLRRLFQPGASRQLMRVSDRCAWGSDVTDSPENVLHLARFSVRAYVNNKMYSVLRQLLLLLIAFAELRSVGTVCVECPADGGRVYVWVGKNSRWAAVQLNTANSGSCSVDKEDMNFDWRDFQSQRPKSATSPFPKSHNIETVRETDGCPKTPIGCFNTYQFNNQNDLSDTPESAAIVFKLAGASCPLLLAGLLPQGGNGDNHTQNSLWSWSLWMSLFYFCLILRLSQRVCYTCHHRPAITSIKTGNTASDQVNNIH